MKYPNKIFIDIKTLRYMYQTLLANYNFYHSDEKPEEDPLLMLEVSNEGDDSSYKYSFLTLNDDLMEEDDDEEGDIDDPFGFGGYSPN